MRTDLATTSQRRIMRQFGQRVLVCLGLMSAAASLLGATLGLFLFGLVLCAILLPAMLPEDSGEDLFLGVSVTDSIALVWLAIAVVDPQISLWQWFKAYLILLSVGLLQWALLVAFRRVARPVARALATLGMLAWLTAPIWLLHHLQTPARLPWMQRVIDLHPVFAMNSAVPLSVWTESPLTYRLLNLNQDVPYSLPGSPWWSIVVHAVLGAAIARWAVGRVTAPRAFGNTP